MNSDQLNSVSGTVLDSAIAVHRVLGPRLLESAYRACLAFELRNRGLDVMSEVPLPVVYEGHQLEVGYRIDLLVAKEVVVEVKAIEGIAPIHRAQLLTYLRLSGKSLGLFLNFNVALLKDGVVRMRNGY